MKAHADTSFTKHSDRSPVGLRRYFMDIHGTSENKDLHKNKLTNAAPLEHETQH